MTESPARPFFVAGGTVPRDAPSYVERQADRALLDGLTRGEFCYVLTSRQMGKSSLMVRTAAKLRESGCAVAVLDLTAVGQNLTPEQWYDGLLNLLARALDLEDELERFWLAHERLSPLQRWMEALREVVLRPIPGKVVVFIDEIDAVRSIPFSADEFFAGIRECYNRRSEDPEYERLTFCLLGVAAPSDLIRDTRTTPFNIGRRIDLSDFTLTESEVLIAGLQVNPPQGSDAGSLMSRVLFWTGGHPYLTQRLCQAVAESHSSPSDASADSDVDSVCQSVFMAPAAREREDNLLFVRERILRSEAETASLLGLYSRVLRGNRVEDDETNPLITILKLSGIVRPSGKLLRVRNRIYERVFDSRWVHDNLPHAEIRRQLSAYWRGVLRATALFSVFLFALAVLAAYAIIQRDRAEMRLRTSLLTEARSLRASGRPGQYFTSLELLQRAARIRQGDDLTNEAIAALASPIDLRPIRIWNRRIPRENICGWDAINGTEFYTDAAGKVELRSRKGTDSKAILPPMGREAEIYSLTRDGKYARVTYGDPLTCVWEMESAKKLWEGSGGWHIADFDSAGTMLATYDTAGTVTLRSLPSLKIILRLRVPRHQDKRVVRFNPLGTALAVSVDRTITIFNLKTYRRSEWTTESAIEEVAWAPDGDVIACGEDRGAISLWKVRTGSLIRTLYGHTDPVTAIAFSHRGDLLATSSWDESLRIWDPRIGHQLLSYPCTAVTLHFSMDDRMLLGGGSFSSYLFEVGGGQVCRRLCSVDPGPELWASEFNVDGSLLFLGVEHGLEIWNTVNERLADRIGGLGRTRTIAMNRAGNSMLTVSNSNVLLWPVKRRRSRSVIGPARKLPMPAGPGNLFGALQLDGGIAVTRRLPPGAGAGRAHIFDTHTFKEVGRTSGLDAIGHVAITRDARWVAYGSSKARGIRVWDRLKSEVAFNPPIDSRAGVAFSPNGKWLVTREPLQFQFWEVGTWRRRFSVSRSEGGERYGGVSFPGDCRWAAISDSPTRITLIDPASGGRIVSLNSPIGLGDNVKTDQSGTLLAVMKKTQVMGSRVDFTEVWDLRLLRDRLTEMGLNTQPEAFPPSRWKSRTSPTLAVHKPPRARVSSETHGIQPRWAGN